MITLRSDGAELDLLPEVGGAVAHFAVEGRDVLRPAPHGTKDVLQTGCFALLPFANRIAFGKFSFAGESVSLPRNFGDHPHALHGQGWQQPWRIASQTRCNATLAFEHVADAWPWDYAARQFFELTARSLRMELEITNRSARAMPVSLGFHPYFERTPQSRLRANVAGVWLSDDTGIPTGQVGPCHFLDLKNGAALAGAPFVDHCHYGWDGTAVIAQPEYARTLALTATPALGFLHCFVPAAADFFCLEPVSAMPDAFNRPETLGGLRTIAPRDALTVSMTLSVHGRDW